MRAVRKEVPTQQASRVEIDFDAISAAFDERLRNESPEQRVLRMNREQRERQVIWWDREERLRQKSANGNLAKSHRVELRFRQIEALWPAACEKHPRNLSKRYEYLVDELAKGGCAISHHTLVSRDLPKLRAQGKLQAASK